MAVNTCLGIHYDTGGVTAALVEKTRTRSRLVEIFKISPPKEKSPDIHQSLIEALVGQIAQRHAKNPPVALALSGLFYQSQTHQSEFKDQRMLKQTLRFDVEEDFAVDAESFALCYQSVKAENLGHNLIVHTLDRENIQTLLEQLEAAGLDALVAEPDLDAWIHYIKDSSGLPNHQPMLALAWTSGVLYLMVLDQKLNPVLARSCVCSSPEGLEQILFPEINRSLALLDIQHQPQQIIYHPGRFSPQLVAQITNTMKMPVHALNEPDAAIAFAGGAALGWLNRQTTADFRSDGLPPRTMVAAQNKALLGLSAALIFLLVCTFLVLQSHANNYESQIVRATQQLERAWNVTQPDRDPPIRDNKISGSRIKTRLQGDINALQDQAGRQRNTDLPNSVSRTLYILLETLHTLPETFDLRIENIRVSNEAVILTGLVRNLDALKRLHQAFKDNPSWAVFGYQVNTTEDGSRFTVSVPVKQPESENDRRIIP